MDLSAAFDTIEHRLLLSRFEESLGISGVALDWCRSYFADRQQSVNIHGTSSVPRPLTSGMPQGSVIGPFGFPVYTGPVGRICEKHKVSYHFYADDTQLYLSFDPKDEAAAKLQMEACIREIREWMSLNYLKLNDSKTEFVIIGTAHQLQRLTNDTITIGNDNVSASNSARNIGAYFDKNMNMKKHIQSVCRACYCHIRNIGKVRRHLTQKAAQSIIHAFISSRVDHMNALVYGCHKYLLLKLQKIQNNAARIVTRSRRRDHITPVLSHLHWLPIEKRIEYKIQLTTFKALHGLAPGYISDLLTPYEPTRTLRSINLQLLTVPRVRSRAGERSFAVCGPSLWNKLPANLRAIDEVDSFKAQLKTHLYSQAYPD